MKLRTSKGNVILFLVVATIASMITTPSFGATKPAPNVFGSSNWSSAPAPVVKAPAPAPVVKAPAPAPVVKAPAPAPVVKAPAPAPVVKAPAPAPVQVTINGVKGVPSTSVVGNHLVTDIDGVAVKEVLLPNPCPVSICGSYVAPPPAPADPRGRAILTAAATTVLSIGCLGICDLAAVAVSAGLGVVSGLQKGGLSTTDAAAVIGTTALSVACLGKCDAAALITGAAVAGALALKTPKP